jgi:ssDNA-binding Zn-finger/Zn-ribbon topoisomerase 1
MKIKNLDLPMNTVVGYCSKCGGLLRIRDGMYGRFIGCENFRDGCRNTININQFEVDEIEYKMLKILSDIWNNNQQKVLEVYHSDDYYRLSDELKSKVETYLFGQ